MFARIPPTFALVALLLTGCGHLPGGVRVPAGTTARARMAPADPDRLVVGFRHGLAPRASALAARQGLVLQTTIAALDAAVLAAPHGTAAAHLAALRTAPELRYAEPDYLVHATDLGPAPVGPAPDLAKQWGLAKIQAPAAWAMTRGSADVIVAVLDTGVDLTHPDLRANLVPGTTFFPAQGGPIDKHGHGSHVAGIVAGNGPGIQGVAPGCKVMPVKVMGPDGPDGKVEFVAAGLVWAVDHGARVVNMSLGDEGSSTLLRDAVAYAAAKDVLVVAAAGNVDDAHPRANTLEYPAGYPGVMAVGAVDEHDGLADFSFWGSWLSVVAPGVDIWSSVPEGAYKNEDGTSMASPCVAGVAALVRSRFPKLTAAEVKARLERTAVDLGAPGYDDHYGHGRVDALRALTTP